MSNKLKIKIIIIIVLILIALTILQNIQIAMIILRLDRINLKNKETNTDYLIHTRIL